VLDLSGNEMNSEAAKVLGNILASGSYPRLEELYVGDCDLGEEGVASIVQGLEAGRCCSIRKLVLSLLNMQPSNVIALARAVDFIPLSGLQELYVSMEDAREHKTTAPEVDGSMAKLVRVLAANCPKLSSIDFGSGGMRQEAGEALL